MQEVPRIARSEKQARSACGSCALCFVVLAVAWPAVSVAQQASSTVYVRADTDRTVVVTPRLSVQAPLDDATRVDVAYSMDVWSSASIDIRTSASRPVTERRDEINAAVTHDFEDASFSLAYRYSYEPDYESHFVNAGLTLDFADKASTLAIGGGVSFDDVGRVGTPSFERTLRTVNGQATFTQILDAQSLFQLVYAIGYADGYQSSPYRYVGIGTYDGACPAANSPTGGPPAFPTQYCLPENNPAERMHHAFVAAYGRALSDVTSARLTYRFYLDDWEVMSHTGLVEFSWLPALETVITLRYRFYRQSQAAHYRSHFPSLSRLHEYYSRDKELSQFMNHRLSLDAEKTWSLGGIGEKFQTVVSVGPTLYLYDNFIPYKRIMAFEVTLSGVLVL
jgi:hypothetical protein